MEEIKVGEYVRTTSGIIDQIENYDAILDIYFCKGRMSIDKLNMIGTHLTNIVKHSPNKIDLVEVGDIVNDYKILEIDNMSNPNKKAFTIFKHNEHSYIMMWSEEDIKTILTKEQYEANCFRLEEV